MQVIVFDLIGKMAHFRQYYTNSSSLSSFFPSRTTLAGMVAGMMGMHRDSYYPIFSEEKARFALSVKSPLRKKIYTVNYVWAENPKQLNLSKGQHTQVPLEIVLPSEYRDLIVYRVFLAHQDQEFFRRLSEIIMEHKIHFPPYLGLSEFPTSLRPIWCGTTQEKTVRGEWVLNSVVNISWLREQGCSITPYQGAMYVKELLPLAFDENRRLCSAPREFVGEIKQGEIHVKGQAQVHSISQGELEETIVFLEE